MSNSVSYPMAESNAVDADILEALRIGERDRAITALVRRYQRFVYSVALRQMNHVEDAQDITQDVLLRAARFVDGFQQQSSLQTWLYRITINQCRSEFRRRRIKSFFGIGSNEGEVDVASSAPLPSQHAEERDFDTYMQSVLDKLPPKQRETFCLRFYDELSYEQISAMTGTSQGALKANYHWAIKKIADHLKESEFYAHWSGSNDAE
ncbi:MAG TPA: RNA polymerase subunit sigma [Bacteroidetes bacterium]|nr:RNA polymerase subunit sigma [Bacteroidota bacterium]